ncbi:MAG TPA: YbhB/YbcL family Raf kinase inhibitor-like protein [Candidatus Thermoplasmatota archaeon]|jgi:hypothetical protein|nr:YbhB/YbcL family Raf kinase inhibitor-like protein [Candidatus Thermoplasmatota archaeon]
MRALALAVAALALAGCASGPQPTDAPQTLTVASPAFAAGQPIPREYTCQGTNHAPPLALPAAPPGAVAYALAMDDPDAPRGTFTHWTWWNVPASTRALPAGADIGELGGTEGSNSAGRVGYTGPCPPTGAHHYRFRVFAQDRGLGLGPGAGVEELGRALAGRVMAWGELVGTYEKG